MMNLQAVVVASFVGIGVLVALYAEKRVALPSLAELRANIWAADSHLASLEARKDGILNRLRTWLDQAGLRRLHVLEFLALTVAAAIISFLVALLLFGGYVLSLELAMAGAVAPTLYVLTARRGREEAIEEQLDRAPSILIKVKGQRVLITPLKLCVLLSSRPCQGATGTAESGQAIRSGRIA